MSKIIYILKRQLSDVMMRCEDNLGEHVVT